MLVLEVPTSVMNTSVSSISRLPKHFEKCFCTVFNIPDCAESQNDKIIILGSKMANELTKV